MRLKHTGWEALEEQKKANQHQFAIADPTFFNQLISVLMRLDIAYKTQRWKRTCEESRSGFSEVLPHHLIHLFKLFETKNGWVSWCFLCGCHLCKMQVQFFIFRGCDTVVDAQTWSRKKPQWTRVFWFCSSCEHVKIFCAIPLLYFVVTLVEVNRQGSFGRRGSARYAARQSITQGPWTMSQTKWSTAVTGSSKASMIY